MAYETPAALRQALEARLLQHAMDHRVDVGRLRRRVVFERILVRLDEFEPRAWVLKGGMALEVRLGDRARSTLDLDMAVRERSPIDPGRIRVRLVTALGTDPERDGFVFAVAEPQLPKLDAATGPAVRFSVRAALAGREFATVHIDVAGRLDEVVDTERLPLPGALSFSGRPARTVELVSANQQFSEKLHALTRDYGSRENTRVRDMADLLLLIERNLLQEGSLVASVETLFRLRGSHPVPETLPTPPDSWIEPYARLARDLELHAQSLPRAIDRLADFWHSAGVRRGRK